MSCERFIEAIRDHAFGAPLDTRGAEHLAGCRACQRCFEEHRGIVQSAEENLRREMGITASAGFAARVLDTVAHRHPLPGIPSLPLVRRAAWMGLAAAAVLMIAIHAGDPDERAIPARASQTRVTEVGPPAPVPSPPTSAAPAPSDAYGGSGAVIPPGSVRPEGQPRTRLRPAGGEQIPPAEVLVPRTQDRAIARLHELIAIGALDERELPSPAPLDSPPAELVITPLVVPDIVIPDVLAGVATPGAGATQAP